MNYYSFKSAYKCIPFLSQFPVKRKKGSSSLNELQPPPYQDKEDVKHCLQGYSDSADGTRSEVSECSEDTEGYLHRAYEEDAPSDSTAVLGPEVRTSPRRFPRCLLLWELQLLSQMVLHTRANSQSYHIFKRIVFLTFTVHILLQICVNVFLILIYIFSMSKFVYVL